MNPVYEKLKHCLEAVREKTDFVPKVGLVLGSGLGDYAKNLEVAAEVDYADIPDFPTSTAPGHAGKFVFGYAGAARVPVVCMQGRVHYYEGYDMTDVVLPVRLMGLLGIKILFLTNASGGIRQGFSAGDLMLLTGQISFFVPSPLRGENIPELGPRFPDMSQIYDPSLQECIKACAVKQGISLKQGVYAQTQGPNYESPEEIHLLRTLGADAVGMSTACEAIAARHMGIRICGISCISNLAAGISPQPLSEEEVLAAGRAVSEKFSRLVTECLQSFHTELGQN